MEKVDQGIINACLTLKNLQTLFLRMLKGNQPAQNPLFVGEYILNMDGESVVNGVHQDALEFFILLRDQIEIATKYLDCHN